MYTFLISQVKYSKISQMFYTEDSNFLTDQHKQDLDKIFTDQNFPFYFAGQTISDYDGVHHFIHHFMNPAMKQPSPYYPLAEDILKTFCVKNKIAATQLLRAAINVTLYSGKLDKCSTHRDHTTPHHVLLIYLDDSKGDTVILDKKGKPFKIVEPKKYKGICFENAEHYHYFPISDVRRVLVFTFN